MYRLKTFTNSASSGRPLDASLPQPSLIDFYREEFLKLQQCLHAQREFFSEGAVSQAERALLDALGSLDQLCCRQDADHAVSSLLCKFDVLARLAAWSDPRQVH
jgi:hypothetical protein